MTVSDNVVVAIEKTLLRTPAKYRYKEVISKAFLATAGQQSWKQEDIFTKEPIRRQCLQVPLSLEPTLKIHFYIECLV